MLYIIKPILLIGIISYFHCFFSFRVPKPPYIFKKKSKMVCSYRQNCEFVYYYIVCSVTIVQAGTRRTWKKRSFSAHITVTKLRIIDHQPMRIRQFHIIFVQKVYYSGKKLNNFSSNVCVFFFNHVRQSIPTQNILN